MTGKAYIVIDMLNDFMRSGGALFCGEDCLHIIAPIVERLQAVRLECSPVIYACDSHGQNDPEFKLYPPHAIKGTDGARIIDAIEPYGDSMCIHKTSFSAFYETSLHSLLQSREIHTLRIMGVCTNICVLCTALDAVMRGYEVEIHENEVASFDKEAHKFVLQQLEDTFMVKVIRNK